MRQTQLWRIAVLAFAVSTAIVRAQTDQTSFDFVLSGTNPAVSGSSAVLVLDTTAQSFRLSSTDTVLGSVLFDGVTPSSWLIVKGTPDRLLFQAASNGIRLQADFLLDPYSRGVVDLVRGSKRIRYLLTPGCACLVCTFPSQQAVPAATANPAVSPVSLTPTFGVAEDEIHYFFFGIGNEKTDEDNPTHIVAWLQKFSNWKDLKIYSGEANGDKASPIWTFKNQTPKQIAELLADFKVKHAVTKNDVFIFYYGGHMTFVPDDDGDEGGGSDASLFKDRSREILRDDQLAILIQAIGADDAAGKGTLRIAIMDTCNAQSFYSGGKDLKTVKNLAMFFSTKEDQLSYTPKWHDSILRVQTIDELDKGKDSEPAGNNQVNFDEWAAYTIQIAESKTNEVPGYTFEGITDEVYRRAVLKK